MKIKYVNGILIISNNDLQKLRVETCKKTSSDVCNRMSCNECPLNKFFEAIKIKEQ